MISEANFSKGYSSFWTEYTPWLSGYVDEINKDDSYRIEPPITYEDVPAHRSINSIVSFTRYRELVNGQDLNPHDALALSIDTISRFPRTNIETYSINVTNYAMISDLSDRLYAKYCKDVIIDPFFCGCGIIDNCNGDILKDDTLVEVKTGNRKLLVTDIKQLLVYCALNTQQTSKYDIINVEIYNPRMGQLWSSPIGRLINDISPISQYELFDELCKYISDMTEKIIY